MKRKIRIGKLHVASIMAIVVLFTAIGVYGAVDKAKPWHSWTQVDLTGADPWTGLTAEHVPWEGVTSLTSSNEYLDLLGICEDSESQQKWILVDEEHTAWYSPITKYVNTWIYLGNHQKCYQSTNGNELCQEYLCPHASYINDGFIEHFYGACEKCVCPAGSIAVTHNTGRGGDLYPRRITYCYKLVTQP